MVKRNLKATRPGPIAATVWALLLVAVLPVPARAESPRPEAADAGKDVPIAVSHITDNLDFTLKILAYGLDTELADEVLLEGDVTDFPLSRLEVDVRPDIRLTLDRLTASIKPRFDVWRQDVEKDGVKETETESDFYVNEWLIRPAISDTLFISYSRENLQWGPSYMLSPSNPFNSNNGRNNPKQEVPGMDYVTLLWAPTMDWTVSLIANVDNGRRDAPWNADEVYHRGLAGAEAKHAEARQEIEEEIDEALDLAAETRKKAIRRIKNSYRKAVRRLKERRHLRPGDPPFPIDKRIMKKLRSARDNFIGVADDQYRNSVDIIERLRIDAEAEAEAEYQEAVQMIDETTRDLRDFRPTYAMKVDWLSFRKYLSLIFSHREGDDYRLGSYAKWDATDAIVLYGEGSVSDDGDTDFLAGISYTLNWGPILFAEYYYNESGESYLPLGELLPPFGTIDVRDELLRRNYALFQLVEGETFDSFDLALRWIANLDDNSDRLITQVMWDLNDYFELFFISGFDFGKPEDEFSLFDYSVSGGVEFSF
jgi:hypothetical protein